MLIRDECPTRHRRGNWICPLTVVTTAASVHDLTPASELLHGDGEVVLGLCYQGIAKRPEMAGNSAEFWVTIRPGIRRALPETPDGMLQDLIETAKAHIHTKVEHSFRAIKQQYCSRKPGCDA